MEKRENFSRKRLAILSALRETTEHPTADWVYGRLKPRYPDLSLGTVYRNLKLFCQTGKAISVGVVDGKERFDGVTAPHAHFVCEECGAVLDVPQEKLSEEQLEKLSRRTGGEVHSVSILFRGVCEACKKAGKAP